LDAEIEYIDISEEKLAAKRRGIRKAAQKVTEAKGHLKARHNKVKDNLMPWKNVRKEKIKEAGEVEIEE